MKILKIILCSIAVVQISAYAGDRGAGMGLYPDGNGGVTGTPPAPGATITYPQFTPLPLVNNKQWYWLKLAANSTQGYIVAWDADNQNSQCLATFAPVGPSCRRPPINASNQDLVDLINLNGRQDAKGQSIGILTCNSPDYVKAWGQVSPNATAHWCNVVGAQLNPMLAKVSPDLKFPLFVPLPPIDGKSWYLLMQFATSTQYLLVSWNPTSNNAQCLAAAIGQGQSTISSCRRPPITSSPDELINMIQRQGQKDDQQKLIATLTCNSADYIRLYGQVDANNQNQWCNMVKANLNPTVTPLTPDESSKVVEIMKKMQGEGKYPVLDRTNSVAGTDTGNKGVRDDVAAWINKKWTDPKENKAVMQNARLLQSMITVDLKDKAAVKRVNKQLDNAINCLGDTFKDDAARAEEAFQETRAITLNTIIRTRAFFAFDAASDGTVGSIPDGDTCEK